MFKRRKYSTLLVVTCLWTMMSSCTGVDRSLLIIQGAVPIVPLTLCLPTIPTLSSEYMFRGQLELGVGETSKDYFIGLHLTYPFQESLPNLNQQFPNYGNVPTANRLTLQEIEFLIESETEYLARLESDGVFDWEAQTTTTPPTGVPLALTSLQSNGDLIAQAVLPLDNLTAPAIAGDREIIVVHAVVRAITQDGDQLESSVLQFPIEICNGCLSNPICPVGTEQVPVLLTPCNPGQDEPLFTCEVPGATQQ